MKIPGLHSRKSGFVGPGGALRICTFICRCGRKNGPVGPGSECL